MSIMIVSRLPKKAGKAEDKDIAKHIQALQRPLYHLDPILQYLYKLDCRHNDTNSFQPVEIQQQLRVIEI